MNIFFELSGGISVNLAKVREIRKESSRALRFTFQNGEEKVYKTYGDSEIAHKRLDESIIQLIPCSPNVPLFNVYCNDDGSYFHEPVAFMALCADGLVRSISTGGGEILLADESANFKGCFDLEALGEYPERQTAANDEAAPSTPVFTPAPAPIPTE